MNEEQLNRLIAALAPQGRDGGQRLPTFTTATSTDWLVWRRSFLVHAQKNNWNARRQKMEIVSSMQGQAAQDTQGIPWEADDITPAQLLDRYEAKFVPAAAGQLARAEFADAQQHLDESINAFHSRLLTLFRRAYPGRPNPTNDVQLIEAFGLKLLDAVVSQYTLDANPATYEEALQVAQRREATKILQKDASKRRATINGINQIQPSPKRPRVDEACYFCNKSGHYQQDCWHYKKARQQLQPDNQQNGWPRNQRGLHRNPRPNRGFQGRPFRGRGPQRGYLKNGPRRIYNIQEPA